MPPWRRQGRRRQSRRRSYDPQNQRCVDAAEREVVVHGDARLLLARRLAHVVELGAALVELVERAIGRDPALAHHGDAEGGLHFFFSSRRRHTRWNCDWSSDVCSSDLLALVPVEMSLAALALSWPIPVLGLVIGLVTLGAEAREAQDYHRALALQLPTEVLSARDRKSVV